MARGTNRMSWIGRDMAVDLGTANTLVYVRGRGIVLNEPSVVAVNQDTGAILAVGLEAKRMIGRTPGNIVAMVAQGERVIEGFRKMAGATDPTVAEAGTIRGDLARDMGTKVVQNIVHGSDSVESAEREIKIFFGN